MGVAVTATHTLTGAGRALTWRAVANAERSNGPTEPMCMRLSALLPSTV
jgi:hypothetical protein